MQGNVVRNVYATNKSILMSITVKYYDHKIQPTNKLVSSLLAFISVAQDGVVETFLSH